VSGTPLHQYSKRLEMAAAIQATAFLIGVSWAFGGNADWVRTPISVFGTLGPLLTLAFVLNPGGPGTGPPGKLAWAIPVGLLNLLVLLSCLTPGFRDIVHGDTLYLMPVHVPWWKPSAARPEAALRSLWIFDGIYFSCFNVLLCIRSRSVIRKILAVLAANALVLSVFGTVQKLTGASGLYFGRVKSPQDYFFASFVYDNHWGAFIVLMLGACAGLILRYLRGIELREMMRGPSFLGIVMAFLIAVTVPMSGARMCTLLVLILAFLAVMRGTPAIYRVLRISRIPRSLANLLLAAVAACVIWGAWLIAGEFLSARAAKTGEQLREMWARGGIGARTILYHDTWRMALDRPLFGWGMGSYPSVFSFYNTQQATGDHIPVVYHDAHSDWLQCIAELGFAGLALIGAAVALPALSLRGRHLGPVSLFLLLGCALVAAYAWMEFPFGNVAVVLAWWLCFSCAVQYARLSPRSREQEA